MNTLTIFYINKNLSTKGDDDLCPICEEHKVSLVLECYVIYYNNNFNYLL